MAPRRGARVVKVDHVVNYDNLTVKQVLCPICRSILIEPVTLPCNHVFCSTCFQGTMENANLVCPLCRMRIGSWLRSSKKENKLINVEYWNAIKKLFPDQIKNKLEGIEENLDYDPPLIRLAEPGELNKEYQTQFLKEAEKIRKEREAESKASEDLIRKLKEEDDYRKTVVEEKLRLDEEIAKKLAEELNKTSCMNKPTEVISVQSTSKLKIHNNHIRKVGPLERFLKCKGPKNSINSVKDNQLKLDDFARKDYTCRILCQDIGSDWNSATKQNTANNITATSKMNSVLHQVLEVEGNSDSSDSIDSEYRYFKPIDYRRSAPCQQSTLIKVPAIKAKITQTEIRAPEGENTLRTMSNWSAFASFTTTLDIKNAESNNSMKTSRLTQSRRNSACPNKKQVILKRVKALTTEKKPIESQEKIRSPDKKNNNFITQEEKQNQFSLSPNKVVCEELSKMEGVNSHSKRKIFQDSSSVAKKKSRPELNYSISRLLATPSSPFKGFGEPNMNKTVSIEKSFKNTCNKIDQPKRCEKPMEDVEKEKIRLQVKADYELARKLQSQFNGASYSTRSSAPKKGIKVTRQTTLDNVLLKKSYKI